MFYIFILYKWMGDSKGVKARVVLSVLARLWEECVRGASPVLLYHEVLCDKVDR